MARQLTKIRYRVYNKYKCVAGRRGISFTLSYEAFNLLNSLPCFYCGRPPSNIMKSNSGMSDIVYQGVDREDSNKGYTRSNSVPCCGICNKAKSDMNHIEFLAWISKVHKYSIEEMGKT